MKKNNINLYYLKHEQEEYLKILCKQGNLNAFSMVELVLSLLIISLILAALTPVITKRAHQMVKVDTSMSIYSAVECSKWFNEDCQVCTKNACLTCDKICADDEYKNVGTCECEKCSTRTKECIRCNSKLCTRCREGYPLVEGKCADVPCAEGSWTDGFGGCKQCPLEKYCLDGLVYNREETSEESSLEGYEITLDKYKREFEVVSLVGAGGAGGKGNFRQSSMQNIQTYYYPCNCGYACTRYYCDGEGNSGSSCGCMYGTYACYKTCVGYNVISVNAFTSYGGGGGGAGGKLSVSTTISQDIIDSTHGGTLKAIVGSGTSGNGNPSGVFVVKNNKTWWSISVNGGLQGIDALTTSPGGGGKGANAANSCLAGANGSAGGGATNSAGAQGAGGGSGHGAGGKGGTVIVNANGKQGEIAPSIGANGFVKVKYIKLTR